MNATHETYYEPAEQDIEAYKADQAEAEAARGTHAATHCPDGSLLGRAF